MCRRARALHPRGAPQVLRVLVQQRLHRVAVVDVVNGARKLVGVITQTAVLRFLRAHLEVLAPVLDVSMSQFLLPTAVSGACE